MDQHKVFFISPKHVSDKDCTAAHLSELSKFSKMLEKKALNYLILSSPIKECLQFAEHLSNTFKTEWLVLRELSTDANLFFDNNINAYQSYPQIDPTLFNPIKLVPLIDFLLANDRSLLFVVDHETFTSLKPPGRTREDKNSLMHEYDAGAKVKNEMKNSKIIEKNSGFRTCLRIAIVEMMIGLLPKIENIFEHVRTAAEKTENTAEQLVDLLKTPANYEELYENQLKTVSAQLQKAETVLEQLQSTVDTYESLAAPHACPQELKGKLKILSFMYDLHTSSWTLVVKNKSIEKIPNISIHCLETQEKIHTFKLIQGNCKVSATLKMIYKDFYGKNLLAEVSGTVVSEPFTVYPYQLSVSKLFREGEVELKVTNCSIPSFSNVALASSTSRRRKELSIHLCYKSKCFERVVNVGRDNTVFLVSGNQCLSNTVTFSSQSEDN